MRHFTNSSPYIALKPDSKPEALAEEYKKMVNEKEGDVKDGDHRSLGSVACHLRVPPPPPTPPPTATPALHEQSQGNSMPTNPTGGAEINA